MAKRFNMTLDDETAQALEAMAKAKETPATTLAGSIIRAYIRNTPTREALQKALDALLGATDDETS